MCQIFAFKTPYRLALESNGVNFRYTIIKGNKKGKVARVIVFFFFLIFWMLLMKGLEPSPFYFNRLSIRWLCAYFGCICKGTHLPHWFELIRFSPTGADNHFYSKCGGCNEDIRDKYLLQALDKLWHVYCLRCCDCRETLDEGKCFFREGNILCKIDFFRWALNTFISM